MQQEQVHVLTELFHYVNQSPPLDDATSVNCTLNYLEACSKLFEVGFLSSLQVCGAQREALSNVLAGYNYFTAWLDSLLKGC